MSSLNGVGVDAHFPEVMDLEAAPGQSSVARLVSPLRGMLILACLLRGLAALAGIAPYIAVAELGRVLLAEGPLDETRAWTVAGLGAGALAVQFLFTIASSALTHLADVDFQYQLRRGMAQRLSRAPLGWFTERNAGAIKKALEDDVSALHHVVGHSYTDMTVAVVTPLAVMGYLFYVDWRMTFVSLVPVVLGIAIYGLQYRGYGEKMVFYDKALQDVNSASVAFVQGIAVVKTFGQARRSYSRFAQHAREFVQYFWEWVRPIIAISSAGNIAMSPIFALVVILGVGLGLVAAGSLAAVDLIPFAVLGPGLVAPFLALSYAQNDMVLARQAADRIVELLDTPPLPAPQTPRTPQQHRVVFENVRFSYDGELDAVRDINLTLEPGTVTALVGRSGSGKSTLARLLPRFWDPTDGRITIGGVPIDQIPADALYASVGVVFQDVQLLRAGIRENIALGRPDATMEEIERAVQAAQIHDRILDLPRGYDSVAGEDAQLSGGEAQRVSIARAILADAPILVLDEATAFADPEAEAAIQDAISELVAGRTLLVIAHRLHTIVGADQICVLEQGRIVERGTHRELLRREGVYTELWLAAEAPA